MKCLRIGIVGYAGRRGQDFVRLFSSRTDSLITAVADLVEGDTTNLNSNVRFYAASTELFRDPEIDAVVIATPDYLHEEHSCEALLSGKHVFLEKPLAITASGCDRILETQERSSGKLYAGHNLRHFTIIRKLKELISQGVIGEVKTIWCRHFVSYGEWAYFAEDRWHKNPENTCGLLVHKGSHDLDVIHWLANSRATEVVAMGQGNIGEVENLSSVLLQLENGVQANYAQCHFSHHSAREYTIIGTEGTLQNSGDLPPSAKIELFKKKMKSKIGKCVQIWTFPEEKGFHGNADMRIVDEFIGVINKTKAPTISLNEAAWAVKTGIAATHSLRNGNIPVNVL